MLITQPLSCSFCFCIFLFFSIYYQTCLLWTMAVITSTDNLYSSLFVISILVATTLFFFHSSWVVSFVSCYPQKGLDARKVLNNIVNSWQFNLPPAGLVLWRPDLASMWLALECSALISLQDQVKQIEPTPSIGD